MPIEPREYKYVARKLDGGLVTRFPAHMLNDYQSPNAQNFDPSETGAVKKRKGHAKFTTAAKSSPTGTFVSGLFAGTISTGSESPQVWAVGNSGATVVDETADFASAAAGDVNIFPAPEAIGDYFAVGGASQFSSISITISTAGIGGTVTWQYWNGSAWAALSGVTDNSSGFTAGTSTYTIQWTVPTDWAASDIGLSGKACYFVRARVASTYSTNPVATSGTLGSGTFVLATEGTVLHDISVGTWATTISGATITLDTMTRIFLFNNVFIICNEGGGPYSWSGSGSASSLSGSPPANARGGGVHRSRAYLYTNTSTLYASALNSPTDWTTTDNAFSVEINTGDGFAINGFMSGGDFAVVSKLAPNGKEGALYGVYGSGPFDVSVKKLASVGALSQEAMIQYDNIVIVATPRGIFAINGRNWARLDDPVWPTYDAIPNKGTIALGREGKLIKVAYPASGSSNNRELVLDFERGVWGLNTGKTPRVYTNHPDGRNLFGTASTSILVWEDSNGATDDGSSINFIWDTPDFDFDEPPVRKRLTSFHVHADSSPTTTITVDHLVNGTSQSFNETMTTNTQGPVKRFSSDGKVGCLHRIRLSDNSSNGQTKIYGVSVYGEEFEPGFP